MRAFLSPADELLVSLAFFPPGTVDANDKVVGRMDGDNALSRCAPVLKFVGRGLVPILKHVRIVLQLINPGQLDTVTFKLDCDAHLLAGVAATDVPTASSHTPCRIRRPNLVDYLTTTFRQSHALEPGEQIFVAQHESSEEMTSFALSFLPPILECIHKPYSSFIHQFL
jgi:hypothetical protein